MVVKQKRGRKRYILFKNRKKVEVGIIKSFLANNSESLRGKIKWRIIEFKREYSIILVDHTKSIVLRKLFEENIETLGLEPIKTSGTLRALKNRATIITATELE